MMIIMIIIMVMMIMMMRYNVLVNLLSNKSSDNLFSTVPYKMTNSFQVEPGRFVCYQCHAPIDNCITNPFIKKELFEILVENKKCVRNCLSGTSMHPLEKLIYLVSKVPENLIACGIVIEVKMFENRMAFVNMVINYTV